MDPMKKIENRQTDSRREIDILEALDEMRTRNARNERVDADQVLDLMVGKEKAEQTVLEAGKRKLEEEDERLAKFYFNSHAEEGVRVIRVKEDDKMDPPSAAATVPREGGFGSEQGKKRVKLTQSMLGISKKKPSNGSSKTPTLLESTTKKSAGMLSMLGKYGSDSE